MNRSPLVQSCKPIPRMSDHEIIHVTSDISARYQRPVKRKIWLWSKTDQNGLKSDMQCFSQTSTYNNSIKTDVNTVWPEFSSKCLELMSKHVPSKETLSLYSQSWINQGLKRLSRRKKKAYNRKEERKLGSL